MIALFTAMLMETASAPQGRLAENQAECQAASEVIFSKTPPLPKGQTAQFDNSAHYVTATGQCYDVLKLTLKTDGVITEHGTMAFQLGKGMIAELHWTGSKLETCQVNEVACTGEDDFNTMLSQIIGGQ